jgi:F0F1-type ATP synthase membrane subunit b/b'
MDPIAVKAATDAAQLAQDAFRRDYLVASVVVLLLVNGAWAYALSRVIRALGAAQEARVEDQKTAADRLALQLDKNTNAVEALLMDAQRRARARRTTDSPTDARRPISGAPPT